MKTQIYKIKSNPNNPRLIRDDKFEKLKKSIQDFPEMLEKRPLVCVTEGDKYVVLGGNQRLKACKDLGIKEVEIVLADEWTEEQRREFVVKDNIGYGEHDWDILANDYEVEELEDWGVDLPGDFSEEEEELPPEEGQDDVPELKKEPFVVRGDVFEIQAQGLKYRVGCLDATSIDDVEKLMGGEKINLLHTDPPYGIGRDKGFSGSGGFGTPIKRREYKESDWDSERPNRELFDYILQIVDRAVIWGGNFFADYLPQGKHWLVWDKNNTMPTFGDAELAWTNIKRKSVKIKRFEYNGLIGKEKDRFHPTQKPVSLISEVTRDYSEEGENILDLFAGSGSTLVACIKTKRNCYTCDIDEHYTQVTVKRAVDYLQKNNIDFNITLNGENFDLDKLN